jgi:hypothetical protein
MKRLSLSLCLALLALPAAAQEAKPPPAPGDLKLDMGKLKGTAGKGGKLTQAKLVERSREVARGYYNALIAGDFEQAVGFMHPDTIEPTRAQILKTLEAANDGQKKATLTSLGIADINTLRTMPLERFFVTWARSPLGQSVQALSSDKIAGLRVVLDPPRCNLPMKQCQVRITLRGDTKDGKKIEKPNMVFIVEQDGRYLLRDTPPKKAGGKKKKIEMKDTPAPKK